MLENKVAHKSIHHPKTNFISWKSKRFRQISWKIFVYSILILIGIVVMIPVYWTISSALKPLDQALAFPPVWVPKPLVFENFVVAFRQLNFLQALGNTLYITIFGIIGQLISSTMVAYGFARFRFPGRNILFLVALSTMMIPSHILIIPRFVLFKQLGWLDTFKPFTVPAFFADAMYIFMLRQFFMTIPYEMDEAARMDGASYFKIFTRIILPLSKPALGIISVFIFLSRWKDFMGPLIYLSSAHRYTLALALNAFRHEFFIEWNILMAATCIVMIPPVIVFFIAQKYFIQGIVVTGIKG